MTYQTKQQHKIAMDFARVPPNTLDATKAHSFFANTKMEQAIWLVRIPRTKRTAWPSRKCLVGIFGPHTAGSLSKWASCRGVRPVRAALFVSLASAIVVVVILSLPEVNVPQMPTARVERVVDGLR
mmetsp:Transcript_2585/g.3989  ORF Transcript_2585/g.3989 Transcript_2585/m.3989 type:complete len:126 (-) Transcript_2585:343-720(-)